MVDEVLHTVQEGAHPRKTPGHERRPGLQSGDQHLEPLGFLDRNPFGRPASEVLRSTRWAARSAVAQPSHNVGASGPSSSISSQSWRRSLASIGSLIHGPTVSVAATWDSRGPRQPPRSHPVRQSDTDYGPAQPRRGVARQQRGVAALGSLGQASRNSDASVILTSRSSTGCPPSDAARDRWSPSFDRSNLARLLLSAPSAQTSCSAERSERLDRPFAPRATQFVEWTSRRSNAFSLPGAGPDHAAAATAAGLTAVAGTR